MSQFNNETCLKSVKIDSAELPAHRLFKDDALISRPAVLDREDATGT